MKEIFRRSPQTMVGSEVRWDLPPVVKLDYADKIYRRLIEERKTMRVFTKGQLMESMEKGRFVVRVEGGELVGCAQVWPSQRSPYVVEVGTWLSFGGGNGREVMRQAVELARTAREFDGTTEVIACVNEGNTRAQEVLREIGGLERGVRDSDYVENDGVRSRVKVYSLNGVSLTTTE